MKVWVDNELIDDGDFNYIGSRLVHRYSNPSDRNAAIPSPAPGQLAWVYSLQGLTIWDENDGWRMFVPLPDGGTTGQVLAKSSGGDFQVHWVDP